MRTSDDMDKCFRDSWARAWAGLKALDDGLTLRDALLASYAQRHRKYHTQQHLFECLTLLGSLRDTLERPDEVDMALWFHDAIYKVTASDNEERSAAWAGEVLCCAGVGQEAVGRIEALILVTKHDVAPRSTDEAVLADIDLAILGAPEARFAEYERQIRDEYAHVPAGLLSPEETFPPQRLPGPPRSLRHTGSAGAIRGARADQPRASPCREKGVTRNPSRPDIAPRPSQRRSLNPNCGTDPDVTPCYAGSRIKEGALS
jgi:predicted metal-dependent HD superfamily phosphohydrolase